MRKKSIKLFGRGRVFDAWSVPHFFFGVVTAIAAIVFDRGFLEGFLATLILAIAWEWFESQVEIHETRWNMVSDCILPLLAFMVSYQLIVGLALEEGHRAAFFVIALLIYFMINYLAWEARFDGDREYQG